MTRIHQSLLLCLLAVSSGLYAGWNVPVTNFAVSDYTAGTQNWQLTTTANGWLYAANNYGLLEYDGARWRVYGMYYGNLPRSIANYADRAIFIGGTNDFGVFTPTTNGAMRYTSLIGNIEPNFGEVWDIEVVGQQVYFVTRHLIVVGTCSGMDSISLTDVSTVRVESRVYCAEQIGGAVYIGADDGLYLLSGTRLNKIHGSDVLRNYELRGMQALDANRMLIATDLGGLYVYDGTQITPFRTDADAFIRSNQLYTFAVQDDRIAIGTVQQGVVVVNTDGKHCRYVSRKQGLQNNTILSMTFDNRGNLWVGLDQGIDYVQLASTRQFLADEQTNFGTGYATLRTTSHGSESYYFGTNQGLYLTSDPAQPLRLVEGSMGQVWSLSEIDGTIFCCHNRGLFVVQGYKVLPVITDEGVWSVRRLPDGRLLAGCYSGFRLLQPAAGNRWQVTKVKGFEDTAFRWQADATGQLWAVATEGLVRLNWLDQTTLSKQLIQPYDPAHNWINISRLGEDILITCNTYCRVVGSDGVLRRDTALFATLTGETYYALTYKDSKGNILYVHDGLLFIRKANTDSRTYAPEQALYNGQQDFVGGFENVYESDQGYIIGLLQGFCRVRETVSRQTDNAQPVIYLRQVNAVNHEPELLYGEALDSPQQHGEIFVLPAGSYVLRFTCSTNQVPAANTQYAYRLLPRDKTFTPFITSPVYECSSLREGQYTLEVICRTAPENNLCSSVTQTWRFSIRPPWYRTWWARTIMALLILLWLGGVGYMIYMYFDRAKRKMLHEQQLRIIQLEKEQTQTRLQAKSRELTRILHDESSRQEERALIAQQVQKTLHDLQAHNTKKADERLQNLHQQLTDEQTDGIDWQRFEENYDEVNGGFCRRLTERYPWMNKQERKLCIYIRMGMLTKEMAPLLGLSTRGVEMMRYRMRCKMALHPQANLKEFLLTLSNPS